MIQDKQNIHQSFFLITHPPIHSLNPPDAPKKGINHPRKEHYPKQTQVPESKTQNLIHYPSILFIKILRKPTLPKRTNPPTPTDRRLSNTQSPRTHRPLAQTPSTHTPHPKTRPSTSSRLNHQKLPMLLTTNTGGRLCDRNLHPIHHRREPRQWWCMRPVAGKNASRF